MTDKQIHRPLIRPLRRLLKVVQQREPDRLFSLRYAVICVQLQALFAGLELLLLLAAAIVLAYSWA